MDLVFPLLLLLSSVSLWYVLWKIVTILADEAVWLFVRLRR